MIFLCCCGSNRSSTMQTGRSALEAPVPSRRTACRHVPPSLRFTPCQSETGPTAPPCRMEQVTSLLFSDSHLSTALRLNHYAVLKSSQVCCLLSHWLESIKSLNLSVQTAANLQREETVIWENSASVLRMSRTLKNEFCLMFSAWCTKFDTRSLFSHLFAACFST